MMFGRSEPIGLGWRSSTLFICSAVGMGMFTDLFLYSLIVPVLPFMLKDRVQIPDSQVQSAISMLLAAFAGASCLASPVSGITADKFFSSRQVPYLLGLIFLILATILLAFGTSMPVLVIARLLQGASGGVVWTLGLTLLVETVGPENLGKYIGTIFSFIMVAALFAPILGGLLYVKTGYIGVFGVGIGVVGIDLIMRLLIIERKVDLETESGSAQDESSPLLPNESSKDSERYHLDPPKNRLTKAFPMLLVLIDPSFLTSLFTGFVQSLLLGAFDATVPFFSETRYGFDSFKAGLLFIPLGGADLLFGPAFGWAVDRWGTRPVALLGFSWLTLSLVLLRLPVEKAISSHLAVGQEIALYCSLLALNGIGLAIINSTPIVEAAKIMERYYRANKTIFIKPPYAQLYGLSSMLFSGGMTVGPLIAGRLKAQIGYGSMHAVLAGICGFTAVLVFVFMGRR